MTTRGQAGSHVFDLPDDRADSSLKPMSEIPTDMAGQPHDLFDKVIAFTFDVLGHQATMGKRNYDDSAPIVLDR